MNYKKRLVKNFIVINVLSFFAFIYILIVRITSNFKLNNISIPNQYWQSNKPSSCRMRSRDGIWPLSGACHVGQM